MKSIRLNKSIRSSIVENIVRSWKAENPEPEVVAKPSKLELLKAAVVAWQNQVGIDKYLLMGLPRNALYAGSYVNMEVVDENGARLFYYSDHIRDEQGNTVVVFHPDSAIQLTVTDPVYVAWKAQQDAYTLAKEVHNKWAAKRDGYAADIQAVLDSVNTTKQLLEAWPEVERFVPTTFRDPSSVQLPALIPTLPTGD